MRALAQVRLAPYVAGFCLVLCGCEDNICKVTAEALVRRQRECAGNLEAGPVPDHVDCPEALADDFECLLPCYSLPCNATAEAFIACVDRCD